MALEQTAAQIQQLNASIHRLQQTVEHHRMLRDQAQHYANVLQNWVLSYNANHSSTLPPFQYHIYHVGFYYLTWRVCRRARDVDKRHQGTEHCPRAARIRAELPIPAVAS